MCSEFDVDIYKNVLIGEWEKDWDPFIPILPVGKQLGNFVPLNCLIPSNYLPSI